MNNRGCQWDSYLQGLLYCSTSSLSKEDPNLEDDRDCGQAARAHEDRCGVSAIGWPGDGTWRRTRASGSGAARASTRGLGNHRLCFDYSS